MANEDAADVASPRRQPTQKTSSKYDFVKVRVWLADHYYTFSRFLISRVLTVTQVSYADSLKISLSLKKSLVDQNRLDITQAAMEEALFSRTASSRACSGACVGTINSARAAARPPAVRTRGARGCARA